MKLQLLLGFASIRDIRHQTGYIVIMTMTCFELKAALEDLRLSQRALARLCSVEAQQAWRWCDGRTPVPEYVTVILSLIKLRDPRSVIAGERAHWHVSRRHIYHRNQAFKELAQRWHPDRTGRDTNREMALILKFRSS